MDRINSSGELKSFLAFIFKINSKPRVVAKNGSFLKMEYANFLNEGLFSIESGQKLANHQYKGGSLSIMYNYVTGPLCEFLVQRFVPRWVA